MGRSHRMLSGSGVGFAFVLLIFLALLPVESAGATPTPMSISPTSGAPGVSVTISGSGFSSASLTATIGGEPVAIAVASDTSATLFVPRDASPGPLAVIVSNQGVAISPTFVFTVIVLTSALADGEVGANYTGRLTSSGGKAPFSWTVLSGALPTGLALLAGGAISGMPKVAGPSSFTVQVTDSVNDLATFAVSLTIDPGPTIVANSLPSATIGTAYFALLIGTGGEQPYQWSIESGSLPGGLVLSSTGIISGRPGSLGVSTIALRISDALGSFSYKSLPIDVRSPPEAVVLTTASGSIESVSTSTTPVVSVGPGTEAISIATSLDGTKSWVATATGDVYATAGTPVYGGLARPPRHPVVAIAARPDGAGYWLVTASGRVYAFGSARSYGSVRGHVRGRVVSIAATPSGRGYIVLTSRGRVYRFGNAPRIGRLSPGRLHGTAVGAFVTPDGKGVFVASSSGRVFGLGSARTARVRTPPIAGGVLTIVGTPIGFGYWVVTSTGALLAAGSAPSIAVLPFLPGTIVAAASSI